MNMAQKYQRKRICRRTSLNLIIWQGCGKYIGLCMPSNKSYPIILETPLQKWTRVLFILRLIDAFSRISEYRKERLGIVYTNRAHVWIGVFM